MKKNLNTVTGNLSTLIIFRFRDLDLQSMLEMCSTDEFPGFVSLIEFHVPDFNSFTIYPV